jgi:hypothetical protein
MALVPMELLRRSGMERGEVPAAELLASGASQVTASLVTYNPAPVRKHVLRTDIYAPAWLEQPTTAVALFYRDEVASFAASEPGTFVSSNAGASEVSAHALADSPRPWDPYMFEVRFALDETSPGLKQGTVGWIKLVRRARQSSVVPAGAVLESPDGPYVLVFSKEEGTVVKRPVETGKVLLGLANLASGLQSRELVVSSNVFFWDAERRLARAQRGEAPR